MQSKGNSILDRPEVQESTHDHQPDVSANLIVTRDGTRRRAKPLHLLIEPMLWLAAIGGWGVVAYFYYLNP
jgi:hypothetical protein